MGALAVGCRRRLWWRNQPGRSTCGLMEHVRRRCVGAAASIAAHHWSWPAPLGPPGGPPGGTMRVVASGKEVAQQRRDGWPSHAADRLNSRNSLNSLNGCRLAECRINALLINAAARGFYSANASPATFRAQLVVSSFLVGWLAAHHYGSHFFDELRDDEHRGFAAQCSMADSRCLQRLPFLWCSACATSHYRRTPKSCEIACRR